MLFFIIVYLIYLFFKLFWFKTVFCIEIINVGFNFFLEIVYFSDLFYYLVLGIGLVFGFINNFINDVEKKVFIMKFLSLLMILSFFG